MASADPTTTILLLEALAGTTALAAALAVAALRRHRQRRRVLTELVERLAQGGATRQQVLAARLQGRGVGDDPLRSALAQQILSAETSFYKFLVKALLVGNERDLLGLEQQVETLVDALTQSLAATATAAAPEQSAPANADTLKQLIATLQKNHSQLQTDIKSSTESLRQAVLQLGAQGIVAVAAASTATAALAAGTEGAADVALDTAGDRPVTEQPAAQSDDATEILESLPDIDDVTDIPAPAKDAADASTAESPASTATAAADFEQIAEIPDDLLTVPAEDGETLPADQAATQDAAESTPPSPAATAAIAAETAPAQDAPGAAPTLQEDSASAASGNETPTSADAFIDELLADAAASSKSQLQSEVAEPQIVSKPRNTQPAVDEIYAAEPLIPDTEAQADTAATTAPTPPQTPPVNDSAAQEGNKGSNVDDLLAELDELLK
jgi:hypothetical protein